MAIGTGRCRGGVHVIVDPSWFFVVALAFVSIDLSRKYLRRRLGELLTVKLRVLSVGHNLRQFNDSLKSSLP